MIKSLKALFPFVIVIAFLLTGCQASPEKGVVISKRDSANIGRNENSQILSDENQNSDTVKHIQSSRSLCTTDGTIDILFNLDEDINYALLPIYTVMPHYITAGEAKEVANLLFPDTLTGYYQKRKFKTVLLDGVSTPIRMLFKTCMGVRRIKTLRL